MGIEDVEKNGSGTITGLTRYGLGACEIEPGIDVVSRTTSSGNTVSYPLYDAHGNNVGALSKSGSSFVVSDEKSYDAWGGLRSGTNANGKAAYCANLGHKQDDESGLIYMRARYYEPTSGRFVSEDPARDGTNWFTYCANNPIMFVDESGKNWRISATGTCVSLSLLCLINAWAFFALPDPTNITKAIGIELIALSVGFASQGLSFADRGLSGPVGSLNDFLGLTMTFIGTIAAIAEAAKWGAKAGLGAAVVFSCVAYSVTLLSFLVADLAEGQEAFNDPY